MARIRIVTDSSCDIPPALEAQHQITIVPLTIRFGDILVAAEGWVAPGYREAEGAAYMKRPELVIGVDLGIGDGRATIWTCDLTKRYVQINADYRS